MPAYTLGGERLKACHCPSYGKGFRNERRNKVCSLEEAEAFTKKRRKVSIRTVENTIGLARSVANGTTKFPFMGYCADLMEKMLEEIKKARKAQEK